MLSTLKEESLRISQELNNYRSELEANKRQYNELIEEVTEEYKAAAAQGDRSENAAFTESIDKLSRYKASLLGVESQLEVLELNVNEEGYTPIGIVTLYSTVRLTRDDGKVFVFKLFPEGVSQVFSGILDITCPLGQALLRKKVGEFAAVQHRVTKQPITYRIDDIY